MDFKLELVLIPVSDVDRAKEFYVETCGFNLDVDHRSGDEFRVVQITPPGSACSLTIGIGLSDAAPGPADAHGIASTAKPAATRTARRKLNLRMKSSFRRPHPRTATGMPCTIGGAPVWRRGHPRRVSSSQHR